MNTSNSISKVSWDTCDSKDITICCKFQAWLCLAWFYQRWLFWVDDINCIKYWFLNESFVCSSRWMSRAKNMFFTSKRSIKSYICISILLCRGIERWSSPQNDIYLLLHQNVRGLFKHFDLVSELGAVHMEVSRPG